MASYGQKPDLSLKLCCWKGVFLFCDREAVTFKLDIYIGLCWTSMPNSGSEVIKLNSFCIDTNTALPTPLQKSDQ